MKRIGVIGCGVVGGAVAQGFEDCGVPVTRYDKFKEGMKDFLPVLETDIVFISVPTLTKSSGAQDLGALREVLKDLAHANYEGIIVVKSTTLPGTTETLAENYGLKHVAHNPEFLTAAKPLSDFMEQPAIVIGSRDSLALKVTADTYHQAGFQCPIATMDSCAASEMAKYMHNVFLSVKVGMMNEFYDMCRTLHLNYDGVRAAACMMGGIGFGHTKVPGPDGQQGFGGMCFPKDTKAFQYLGEVYAVETPILDATIKANLKRRPELA